MKIYFFLVFLTTQNLLSQSLDLTKLEVAAGSDVIFPGPQNPQSFQIAGWLFENHINADIIEFFLRGSTPSHRINRQYRNRVTCNATQMSFQLKNVQESDAGNYKFINRRLDMIVMQVILSVFRTAVFPQISCNSSSENSIIALTCSVPGTVKSIMWLVIGKVSLDDRYRLIDNNATLIIDKAQKSDSGIYACFANSLYGEANSFFQLTVSASPRYRGNKFLKRSSKTPSNNLFP
ncbi:hemicentin-1-like [Scyliorhinus torazame]|uniref:hemicentin-1-like n=1 Tax=Scyliorhinus torazame TaxID=75743 RepID=UPI003B599945